MLRRRSRSASLQDQIAFPHDIQPATSIEHESTLVWRFPLDISQSSIGGRTTLSNACTLIALKTAELIHIHDIKMPTPQSRSKRVTGGQEMTVKRDSRTGVLVEHNGQDKFKDLENCPPRIVGCLINGIIDGNEAYAKDAGDHATRNYNLPDAIKACGLSFSEVDFKLTTGSMKDTLPKLIKMAVRNPIFRSESRLVFILISCVRTVLIIFDRTQNCLTLFDAHHHLYPDKRKSRKHGALIGTCRYSNLNSFAHWIQNVIFPDIKSSDEAFEISLVRITEVGTNKAVGVCKYPEELKTPLRGPIFQARIKKEEKESGLTDSESLATKSSSENSACRSESIRLSSSPQHSEETTKNAPKCRNKATTRFNNWWKKWWSSRKNKETTAVTNNTL